MCLFKELICVQNNEINPRVIQNGVIQTKLSNNLMGLYFYLHL